MPRFERTAIMRGLWAGGSALIRSLPGILPAFAVVALLTCVLVPLPDMIVDFLLAMSLAGSVLLLVASLTIRRTQEFLTFPILLLLVTLYRLALNISTTRLILSEANAGRVIDAFASFVVRDDMIVGGVIFLIITVVQYVVIARGAERVAEVAARFALDALPGHQAAIEADLRSGAISAREAAVRRSRLAEQSNFYGAMDGAIRFVKGDAVAGLAITGINIVGGLIIGMVRFDYPLEHSLTVFGRLTIGDGLIAQIPALLVSLAAGVLVSRVDRETDRAQVRLAWLEPAMLLVPSGLLIVLALVPGMPALVFLSAAAGLVGGALVLAGRRERDRSGVDEATRIVVTLGSTAGIDVRMLERALSQVRDRCSESLGIDVPAVSLATNAEYGPRLVSVSLGERRLARVELTDRRADEILVVAFRAIMAQAPFLLDLEAVDQAIEDVRARRPIVVQEALRVLSTADVLWIARAFLRERLPLPAMEMVLGVIAEGRLFRLATERARWPELVRLRLARHWVHPVIEALERRGEPRWVRPDPELEEQLLERSQFQDGEHVLAMNPTERNRWWDLLRAAPDDRNATHPPTVLVTTPRSRSVFAALVAGMVPHVTVLSTAELEEAGVAMPAAVWLAPP